MDRADHFLSQYGFDLTRSLEEDTLPLFKENPAEIKDWLFGNMDWYDIRDHAKKVLRGTSPLDLLTFPLHEAEVEILLVNSTSSSSSSSGDQ